MVNKKLSEKYQPPQADLGDTAHVVKRAVLSFIPGATDLFEYFVRPPLQKRLEKWQEDVAIALRRLENDQGVKLETLQNNELFISIVAQATAIAVRNHQKEKLEALKNVIVNSGVSLGVDDDIQLTFVRFLDELTPSHLKLLKFIVENEDRIKLLKSYPAIYELIYTDIPDAPSRDKFKLLIGDLSIRSLIHISQDIDDFEDVYQASSLLLESTNDSLPRIIVTSIAKMFISYIAE